MPFRLDEQTLAAGLNFTLSTSAGDIEVELYGARCRCLDLPTHDLEAIAELRALLEEKPSGR